jgi:AraC-like DNA-binding protein
MKIQTFYPTHPILKEYIQYYYFQKTDSDDFYAEYDAFPNTLQALNIHKNITCKIDSHLVKITGSKRPNYTMVLQGRFQSPLHAQLKGRINKVTIIFKPLGLNHFIRLPFKKIAGEPTQLFTEWVDDKNYLPFLQAFYEEARPKKRIDILENYLVSKYKACEEAINLFPSLALLSDFNEVHSIQEIADKLSLNIRTFNRLFQKHMAVSPAAFRKIARFRNSLKNKVSENHLSTLTKIGYNSNFYDQSYFNKEYKKTTGQNPSKFFKSIEKLADKQLIFRFVK